MKELDELIYIYQMAVKSYLVKLPHPKITGKLFIDYKLMIQINSIMSNCLTKCGVPRIENKQN